MTKGEIENLLKENDRLKEELAVWQTSAIENGFKVGEQVVEIGKLLKKIKELELEAL